MAAELHEATGSPPTLVEGRGGVFQIRREGELIYDKAETGRFPLPGEAVSAIGR